MRRASARISCLSSPASGRKTGIGEAAPTATMFCRRLRSHLSQAIARYDRLGMVSPRNSLRNPQHHAPIQQKPILLGRAAHNLALNRFERDQVEPCRKLVRQEPFHQSPGHMHRGFAGLRSAAPEVNEIHVRATSHHLVSSHRGIKSARQQANHSPGGIRRQALPCRESFSHKPTSAQA